MQKNNHTLYLAIIILISITTLFLPWGSFTAEYGELAGETLTTTGINGHLTFLALKVPQWLLVLLAVLSASVSVLNVRKVVRVPAILPLLLSVFVILWLVCGVYLYLNTEGMQIGLIFMILSTLSLIGLQTRVPRS